MKNTLRQVPESLEVQARDVDHIGPVLRPRRRSGGWIILILLIGFFVWGAFVPLSKGVVAPGTVVVDSKRKTIQHLEGGIIKTIHVRDGSQVQQNDVLLELEDTKARAERDMVYARFLGKLAQLDRLKAQANNRAQIQFSKPLLAANTPAAADLMQLQKGMFHALRLEYENKISLAQQRIGQLQHKLNGLKAYQHATQGQIELLEKEVVRLGKLMKKRLIESSMVAERLQQLSQQRGELGKTVASVAETETAINEAKLSVIQIKREWQQGLARELSEIQESLIELHSQLKAAENVLTRTVIRAPIAGTILGLKATTVGGVLTTADPVTDIVPEDDVLVVDAHVRPLDIDSVQIGMTTHVKLTSFLARITPDLLGIIDNISADIMSSPDGGEPYYLMRVKIAGKELNKLGNLKIVPGMPAEVYVDGGSRTLLQYLFDPISSLIQKSLREE